MRAGEGEQVFSNFLLHLGSGQLPVKGDKPYIDSIEIPSECGIHNNGDIINSIFSDLNDVDIIQLCYIVIYQCRGIGVE